MSPPGAEMRHGDGPCGRGAQPGPTGLSVSGSLGSVGVDGVIFRQGVLPPGGEVVALAGIVQPVVRRCALVRIVISADAAMAGHIPHRRCVFDELLLGQGEQRSRVDPGRAGEALDHPCPRVLHADLDGETRGGSRTLQRRDRQDRNSLVAIAGRKAEAPTASPAIRAPMPLLLTLSRQESTVISISCAAARIAASSAVMTPPSVILFRMASRSHLPVPAPLWTETLLTAKARTRSAISFSSVIAFSFNAWCSASVRKSPIMALPRCVTCGRAFDSGAFGTSRTPGLPALPGVISVGIR